MPTYDYQCFACDHVFEQVQKITEDAISKCPECGKEQVKRLVSATAFHLKGGGWYASGYTSTKTDSKTNAKPSVAKSSEVSSSPKKESSSSSSSSTTNKNSTSKNSTSGKSKE